MMDPSPQSSDSRDDLDLQPNLIVIELRESRVDRDLEVFRKLVKIKFQVEGRSNPEFAAKWKPVIVELLQLLTASDQVGDERVLQGSIAFIIVLFANCQLDDFTTHLKSYWNLEKSLLTAFDRQFEIQDLEWFKLLTIYGYLHVNIDEIYTADIISLPFKILQKNCIHYSKYSYSAYKILQTWLEITWKSNFWLENDTNLEKELEVLIFSNWDNCINEIKRRNASSIFSTYLRIMNEKYEGFFNVIFESCLQNLSWQNETKYTILTEICKLWNDTSKIVSSDLPSTIFTGVTKNHLKHAGTKLYLTILNKIKINDWETIFGSDFLRVIAIWESENQITAIHVVWEEWMKPTMIKFPNVFEYLHQHDSIKQLKLNNSYLERIGIRQGYELRYEDVEFNEILSHRIDDICEPVRLNAFEILCRKNDWNSPNDTDPFIDIKRFLYFNANTSSIYMRKGIINKFDIFFGNIVKFACTNSDADECVSKFVNWLHEFLLDCFEIGSCYQRKILGLNLYSIVMSFTCRNYTEYSCSQYKHHHKATLCCARSLRERMEAEDAWKFTNRISAIVLFKLVLDQLVDVRDTAVSIILDYFDPKILMTADFDILMKIAVEHCDSSKFYEIASGSALVKILATWFPLDERSVHWKNLPEILSYENSYVCLFLHKAREQLAEMRKDILKSATHGSPFFGAMTAILEIGFRDGPDRVRSRDVTGQILDLAEESTDFFLSALSANAKDSEYASSFEEMGLAVEESIRKSEVNEDSAECILSSAHQLVISCIWLSLKVSCQIAAEIGCLAETEQRVRRSMDLIVSVLLKCRHKGAIELAGGALERLTKCLCKGTYVNVVENCLKDLLKIDLNGNVNLTRRGAGFSIMFHKIVSNDDRKNKPLLHYAVHTLLDSLKFNIKCQMLLQTHNYLTDSPRARNLHFLRTLVADKKLHEQLIPYMEDICLTCLEYLQSSEWTVRNASLQLFGAIVPRLVGQCSAKELNFSTGNSVHHFVTHYPILSNYVLRQLESLTGSVSTENSASGAPLHINCNVVPILTLLSKMSTGGCELIDYSSNNYIRKAMNSFRLLFAHPVVHIRVLAGKSYAAFVAWSKIPRELVKLKLEILDTKCNNYKHGQFCAQIYLGRKWVHETKSTSETFHIREQMIYENALNRGIDIQLQRLSHILNRWGKKRKSDLPLCYAVEMTSIKCMIECSASFPLIKSSIDDSTHNFISTLATERTKPGFSEFIQNLMEFNGKCAITVDPKTVNAVLNSECLDHKIGFLRNLKDKECSPDILEILIHEALAILRNPSKSYFVIELINCIRDLYLGDFVICHQSHDVCKSEENQTKSLLLKLDHLSNCLKKIGENSERPFATQLRNIGHIISIKLTTTDDHLLDAAMRYIAENICDDDKAVKNAAIDCLSCLVQEFIKLYGSESFFGLIEDYLNIFVEVMVITLVEEVPELRELMAKTLNPVAMYFNRVPNMFMHTKVTCHRILNKFASMENLPISKYSYPRINFMDRQSIFKRLAGTINISEVSEGLQNPYQDETNHRVDTSFLNILFYCVKTVIERKSPTGDSDSVELKQIDGIIHSKYEFQHDDIDLRNLYTWDIESVLKLSTSDYLSKKKCVLIKMIDEIQ